MRVFEDRAHWQVEYRAGWLAHFQETGQADFKRYNRPRNSTPVSGPGVDLSASRLLLISSAGSYLTGVQPPFDAGNLLGDYTIRIYPSSTPFAALSFAQEHYDHSAVDADPQVLLPLRHLQDMVVAGQIGELAPDVVSFHGYAPDVIRFVDETIPLILAAAQQEGAQAALLVPA